MSMSTELREDDPKDSAMLRAHLRAQENRIRQLATKLVRVMSDRRSRERRDEAQLEDQRNRIRELESTVNTLRDKLHVSRTQLAAQTKLLPQSTHHPPPQGVDSKGALLLIEARAANGALEERVRVLSVGLADAEAELESVTTELRTKEVEHEEEMGALRAALERGAGGAKEAHIADNIHLIRLTRESKRTAAWAATLEAQVQTLEGNLTASAETIRTLEGDLSSVREELRTEQTRALQLQRDAETASSAALRTRDLETQLSAAQGENSILVEANSSLVAKAFAHVERTEADRTQLAQSLATIKTLEESLLRETEAKKNLEVELEAEKSNVRSHIDQVADLEGKIKEVEGQLLEAKKTQDSVSIESKSQTTQEEIKVDQPVVVSGICEKCRNFELDLARAECRLSQAREELSKSKQLLLAQILANKELRNEIEDLSRRLDSADSRTNDQLTAFMKKLEERAAKVEVLEKSIEQLKLPKSKPKPSEPEKCKTPQVEIYIDRLSFQDVNAAEGNELFATWEFDGRPEYTPVVQDGIFNSRATYTVEKTIYKEEMLQVVVEIHAAIGVSDSRRLGSGVLIFSRESVDITTSTGELLGQLTYKISTKNITFCFQKLPEKRENHQPIPVPRKRILPAITTSPAPPQDTQEPISPNNNNFSSLELPENHEETESETETETTQKAIREDILHKNVEPQPQHVVPKPRVEKIIKVKGPPSRSPSPTHTCSLPTVQEEPNPVPSQNLSTVSLQPPSTPKKPILRQNSSSPSTSPKVKKRVTIDEKPEKSKVVIFLSHLVFNVESAHLWRNGQIGGLFAEYRFLDCKPEETESRSVRPPKIGRETEPLDLEFSREFDLNPQRLHMLKSLLESSQPTPITIVSEPLEEDMGDCEDLGSALFVLSRLAHDGSPTLLPIKASTSPHHQIGTIAISVKIT